MLDAWAVRLYRHAPGLALGGIEAAWRWDQRSRRGHPQSRVPTQRELREAFPGLRKGESRRVQERTAGCQGRTWLIEQVERYWGHGSIDPRVDVEPGGEEILSRLVTGGRGVILTTWHAGPAAGVWSVLQRQPVRVLKVQDRPWDRIPENWEIHRGKVDAAEGLRLMMRCRRHLREGGWVAMPFDKVQRYGPGRQLAPLLGRNMGLRTGLPSLAVLSGAPVVLLSSRWSERGHRLRVKVHDPIETDGRGGEAEARILGWLMSELDGFLRAHPWELSGARLRYLIRHPRLEGKGEASPTRPEDKARQPRRIRRSGGSPASADGGESGEG